MTTVSARDYAAKIGYSPSYITKWLKGQENRKEKFSLPYTNMVQKFGNTWLIELCDPFPVRKARKEFRENNKINLVNSN